MTPQRQDLERATRVGSRQTVTTTDAGAMPALFGAECSAAVVAHELRTPLATQRALLELALADPKADVASWREIGGNVLDACRQQERLLQACLVLARSQDRPLRCEAVDLAVLATVVLEAHDLTGLECVVVLEPAWMTGDPDLLERLAANLVSNATRHNTVGGWIEITTRIESRRAHLTVANTGPLVPATELERLFQPFQRLDSSPKSDDNGAGLGLAIVRAIAHGHDGTLAAQPRPSGGLEIDVSFDALH